MKQQEKEQILQELPEKVPEEILKWAVRTQQEELGGEYLIWKAARVRGEPELEYLMNNSFKPGKSVWAAEVTCTCCQETFHTMGGRESFFLSIGPDGEYYTVDPLTNECGLETDIQYVELTENDGAHCPYCGHSATVLNKKTIRGGRTKRIMVESVGRIRDYAVIFYWMVSNEINEFGTWISGEPIAAFVIGWDGGITKFSRCYGRGLGRTMGFTHEWRICSKATDVRDLLYSDWGSICNRAKGAAIYTECPSLIGTTGERTGLYAMATSGKTGQLVDYIKLWKKHKGIENLAVQGFQYTLSLILDSYVMPKGFHMDARRPNEMLGMGKADYRKAKESGIIQKWDREQWREYHETMQNNPGMDWNRYLILSRFYGRNILIPAKIGEKPEKVKMYLQKQSISGSEVQLLVDARRMARNIYNRELTEEELWPSDLRRVHDRLVEMQRAMQREADAAVYAEGFREVKEEYGSLEWTDGELAIFLPMNNGELIREGDVLRHCVGGYGKRHISRKDVIWFVRKYRRPERSYYTLDINMVEGREVQLHGYGNERHGEHKQYSHSIPKKVRDFCDRWEREILQPYIRKREKEKKTA